MQFKFDRHRLLTSKESRASMGPPKAEHCRNDFRYERRFSATRVLRMHVHMAFQEHSPRGAEGSRDASFSVGLAPVCTQSSILLTFSQLHVQKGRLSLLVDTMVRLFCLVAVAMALVRVGYCLDNGLALTPQMVRPVAADCVRHLLTRQRLCVMACYAWRDP
jgi:hypothetical protein